MEVGKQFLMDRGVEEFTTVLSKSMIRLNTSKGTKVQSLRSQSDVTTAATDFEKIQRLRIRLGDSQKVLQN
jgi:hypothetical protein